MCSLEHGQLTNVRIGENDVVGNSSTGPGVCTAIDEENLAWCGLHAFQEFIDELAVVVDDAKRLWTNFCTIEFLPLLWRQQVLNPCVVPAEVAKIDTGLHIIGVEAFYRLVGSTATDESETGQLPVHLVLGECTAGGNFLLGLVFELGWP